VGLTLIKIIDVHSRCAARGGGEEEGGAAPPRKDIEAE
jgi:hypothetical protein